MLQSHLTNDLRLRDLKNLRIQAFLSHTPEDIDSIPTARTKPESDLTPISSPFFYAFRLCSHSIYVLHRREARMRSSICAVFLWISNWRTTL